VRFRRQRRCNTHTLLRWADEMSRYIKSIDRNHLVSVGDEGFYCTDPSSTDWTSNCGEGVDTVAFTRLPAIDVMSFHLYPDSWGKDADWGTQWIKSHFEAARAVGKPAMLGEFGLADKSIRNPVYKTWLDAAFRSGGAGALYWILSGRQDDGTLYPDYDGFTVYCPSPVCTTIANFGKQMNAGFPLSFAPVADDDTAVTEFETPATLPVTANDIAYFPASVVAGSVDLNPATAGQQTTFTVAGRGTFAAASEGSVTFTPDSGFNGKATATYVVRDTFGRLSNAANIVVNVKPSPTAAMTLFDFEDGTQGWAGASWQDNSLNTLMQSSSNASQGSYSLHIQSGGGYWFGVEPFGPVDLSSRTSIRVDLTSTTGTSSALALKVGPGWDWCQITVPGWFTTPHVGEADMGAGGALTFDLTTLDDSCRSKLTEVHALYLAVNGGSDTYIDYVRAY